MGLNGWSNSMNLLWLGDPKSFDVALVGGKAANLSCLAASVLTVTGRQKPSGTR
jgi:hypothetical protein